jgi:hypothetical protein
MESRKKIYPLRDTAAVLRILPVAGGSLKDIGLFRGIVEPPYEIVDSA